MRQGHRRLVTERGSRSWSEGPSPYDLGTRRLAVRHLRLIRSAIFGACADVALPLCAWLWSRLGHCPAWQGAPSCGSARQEETQAAAEVLPAGCRFRGDVASAGPVFFAPPLCWAAERCVVVASGRGRVWRDQAGVRGIGFGWPCPVRACAGRAPGSCQVGWRGGGAAAQRRSGPSGGRGDRGWWPGWRGSVPVQRGWLAGRVSACRGAVIVIASAARRSRR